MGFNAMFCCLHKRIDSSLFIKYDLTVCSSQKIIPTLNLKIKLVSVIIFT